MRAALKLIFPLQNLSTAAWVSRSSRFEGSLKHPKCVRGEINRLLVTQILPGRVRLNRFQNSKLKLGNIEAKPQSNELTMHRIP